MLDPVEPMTPGEAVAERERLRGRLERVQAAADKSAARDREIQIEIKRLEAERAEDRLDALRHGEPPIQGHNLEKIEALEVERVEIAAELDAAKKVRGEIDAEVHYLHVQQFEAFADHAETLGAEALEELEALRPGYEEAIRKWGNAEAEWNTLTDAHNEGRGGPGPTIRADGSVRTREDAVPKLSRTPGCPLRPPAEVFGGQPPRPPEIEVEGTPID
jgi:hypothetical protein